MQATAVDVHPATLPEGWRQEVVRVRCDSGRVGVGSSMKVPLFA